MEPTSATEYPLEARRFAVAGLLGFGLFVFWMAWFIQAPLLTSYWGIQQHVVFGDAEYLVAAVDIAGIFTAVAAGYACDWLRPRKATAICLAVIVVGFGLRPLAVNSFPAMLVLTVIAGLGVPLIATIPAVTAQWFGRHRMNLPLALIFATNPLGQAAGLLLGARMVAAVGAVWTYAILSFALLAALVAWLLLVPEAPRQPAGPPPAERAPFRRAALTVARARHVWFFLAVGLVYAAIITFSSSFLPGVMIGTYHLSPESAGDSIAIIPAAGMIGLLGFGYLARRSVTLRRFGIGTAIVQFAAWLAFTIAWLAGAAPLAVALLLLAVFGLCLQPCFVFGLNAVERTEGITPAVVGVAAGFYVTAVSLGGYLLPVLQAQTVDWSGPKAGFIGLLVLLAIGIAAWAGTLVRWARSERPPVLQPGAVSQARPGPSLPS